MKTFLMLAITGFACAAPAKTVLLNYSLPLSAEQAHLAPFASFANGSIDIEQTKQNVTATYTLPLELTGVPMRLKFFGVAEKQDELSLSGPGGQMACVGHICTVQFARLPIDENAVEAFLVGSGVRGVELEARKAVAAIFRADPGGIIELKEPADVVYFK